MPRMKAFASFDAYLADQPPKNRKIIRALRAFVKRRAPELEESVKWGNGCWLLDGGPVAYVYSDVEYVQFGFIRGSSFSDPLGLLNGAGQYVRHIKVRDVSDIEPRAYGALLAQAVESGPVRRAATGTKQSKRSRAAQPKRSPAQSRSAKRR